MKTPREFLLERHREAETRLAALTPGALARQARAAAGAVPRPERTRAAFAATFWREAIQPWRRFWIGLAAVWVVILGFGFSTPRGPEVAVGAALPPDPQARELLREQRELLAQLLQPSIEPAVAPAPVPGPQGERRPSIRFGCRDRGLKAELRLGEPVNFPALPA